ncbi:hypothetical protein [Streptomyces sp. NPDC091212]|uniref:hypothetical protein n=1 Tax=Streptomyces sp. NPDC091212 TaxID=3155191 RepID=UPI0034313999
MGRVLATQPQALREQVVTNACVLYRLDRRDGHGGIVALDCVYERDTVTRLTPTHRTKRRPNP